jgi:hypothetical protein
MHWEGFGNKRWDLQEMAAQNIPTETEENHEKSESD